MKAPLGRFLSKNPFPHPYTLGFFYREKMRAIHRVAPDASPAKILEIGGGQSGLTALLYPKARIYNIDANATYAVAPCNRQSTVTFLCGDAEHLPFPDGYFDAVTMFDLLEHIPNDRRAVAEALRVLRPEGFLLVTTPNESWKYPFYRFLRRICPSEETLFNEWGHVRRGYSRDQLCRQVSQKLVGYSTFIGSLTALCHDISFSLLPERLRLWICGALSPLTWTGYILHRAHSRGSETAYLWFKEAKTSA